MPETFSPLTWHNDTVPAINETNLNRLEVGVEVLDDRIATLENGIVTPVVVPFATSVTLNATQGSLFRCVASADLTLDQIVGGVDGQTIVFEVQASGAPRVLHFTGSIETVSIASGQWWVGVFRYVADESRWLRSDDSAGTTGSAGDDLNVLAPHNIPYAATITPNAATGALFRITAPGDVTLNSPINGTDGQAVIVEVLASGGPRLITLAGGVIDPIAIPSGSRWTGLARYNAGDDVWVLSAGSSGSGGGGSTVSSVNGQVGVVTLNADSLADGTTKVQMTTTERTKLAGVAAGATAYTGTDVRTELGTALVAGANVTIAPTGSGASKIYTISASATGSSVTVPKNTQTASYTLALADAGKVVELNSATPVILTVPSNASVAFPTDTVIEVCQVGAGQVTVAPDSGTGTTFSEPFTTSLALTWATVFGGAVSVTGGTQGTLSGTDTRVRAQHDVGTSDMFTQCTWTSGGADADRTFGVATRYSSSADTCYVFEVNDFNNRWQFYRFAAGTGVGISGFVSRSIAPSITLRLESQGSTHRCYLDGSLIQTFTDSTITTGQRGGLTGYQPSGILFDNFSTGGLTSIALRTPSTLTTRAQYSMAALRKRATDEWVVSGDLT